jgi:HlyD family secretion protein
MSRRTLLRLLLLVALVAAAAALRLTVFAPAPVTVRIAVVEPGTVEATVTNTRAGTVKARRRAKLSPESGGRVESLPLRRGDRVAAGEVVLALDASAQRAAAELAGRDVETAVARADEVCLGAAQAERERVRIARLAADAIVSPDALDRANANAEATAAACVAARAGAARARANLALAEVEVRKTVLLAPFDAVVAELSIEVGEWTTPSPPAMPVPPVVDLIDPGSLYVAAPMDEVDSGRLEVGLPARITVDARPGERFAGRVVAIAPYVLDREEQNRTVEIEAELADPSHLANLLPGTSADVEVILETREQVLRIPTGALIEGRRALVVGADGVLVERTVELGLRNWDFVEVRAGLAAGDRVVTSLDRAEVRAGARVTVEAVPAGAEATR